MGQPIIKVDSSAGIPKFYDVEWPCDTSNNGLVQKNATLPGGNMFIPDKSFIYLNAWGNQIGEGPNSASIQKDGLVGIQVLKHSDTQIKFRGRLSGAQTSDIFNIPVVEVPVAREVYQHTLTYVTPGSYVENGDTYNIPFDTLGFTPGNQEVKYNEGSPVLWAWSPGTIYYDGWNDGDGHSRVFENMQLLTYIKADGSFDFWAAAGDNNDNRTYTFWIQVMAI